MKVVGLTLICAAFAPLAMAEDAPKQDFEQANAIIMTLEQQRNTAMNQALAEHVAVMKLRAENDKLIKEMEKDKSHVRGK